MMLYDLIILGGGPAGYLAAERAGHAGMKVAVAEERSLGGVCLNEGCIPTKTLLYSAKLYDGVRLGEKYGVRAEGLTIDHTAVMRRKNKVVKLLTAGVKSQLKAAQADVYAGRARIEEKNSDGFLVSVGEEKLTGKRLLIATGSSAAIVPIPGVKEGLKSGFVLTNREILDLQSPPERLCVIGGGVIGLELAGYFSSIGSQVTVVEMLDHIAGETDPELAQLLQAELVKKGVRFELSARVCAVGEGKVTIEKEGEQSDLVCDKVLLSVGRRPNTADIGLEALGVELEGRAVKTDERMRTNVPGVWAAGDVNGRVMLAHTAYREAEVAVNDMLGQEDAMSYDAIPSVIYTNPELSSVGLTEQEAKKRGMEVRVVKLPMNYAGRYRAENEDGRGVMKLITDPSGRVLGGQLLANYSSEFIVALASYIELQLTVSQIKKIIFPHPTVSEIIREAVFQCE